MKSIKDWLEVVANGTLLAAAVAVLIAFGMSFVSKAPAKLSAGFVQGAQAPEVAGVRYSDHQQTLVVALSTNCPHCESIAPLLKRLGDVPSSRLVVLVFPQPRHEVERYLSEVGIATDFVPSVELAALNVQSTPTLLLVGQDGKILDLWLGVLSDSDQHALLSRFGAES